MHKHILIGTVLLLSIATFGIAVAAGEVDFLTRDGHEHRVGDESANAGRRPTVHASETSELARIRRAWSDEDSEDDEGGEGGVAGQDGPADPNAPVPDNGLFNGKDRPKVQVQ